LLCFIGRLSSQKGIDLLVEAMDELISAGTDLFILGKGDDRFQRLLSEQAGRYPGRIYFRVGFDEAMAHLAYAGADSTSHRTGRAIPGGGSFFCTPNDSLSLCCQGQ
jgi:starch synthase